MRSLLPSLFTTGFDIEPEPRARADSDAGEGPSATADSDEIADAKRFLTTLPSAAPVAGPVGPVGDDNPRFVEHDALTPPAQAQPRQQAAAPIPGVPGERRKADAA